MKHVSFWVLIMIAACTEDPSGCDVGDSGVQVTCIVDKILFNRNGSAWEVDFSYNEAGQLVGISKDGIQVYTIAYRNNRIDKVSFKFDGIDEEHDYSYFLNRTEVLIKDLANSGGLERKLIHYENQCNQVIRSEFRYVSNNSLIRQNTYDWSNGNITASTTKLNTSNCTSVGTFDQNPNPLMFLKDMLSPTYGSVNNLILSSDNCWTNPAEVIIQYNDNGYPKVISPLGISILGVGEGEIVYQGCI